MGLTDDDDLALSGVILVADLVGGRGGTEPLHPPRPGRHVHQDVMALRQNDIYDVGLSKWYFAT